MRYKKLPEDYTLVLRQISVDGGDTVDDLIEMIRVDRRRMPHIISSLHHKGLITIENIGYGTWLNLSTKGRRCMQYIWPDSTLRYTS